MGPKKIWLSAARKAVAKDPHTGGGELDHGGVYLKTQMIIEMRLLIDRDGYFPERGWVSRLLFKLIC